MVVDRTEAASLVHADNELDGKEKGAILAFLHNLPVQQGTENVEALQFAEPEFAVLYLQGLRDRSTDKSIYGQYSNDNHLLT